MSYRPIIDAGPGLNFFSTNKERLLIGVLGPLSAPETVQDEVFRKSQQDERFRAAATVWRKLTPNWMRILLLASTDKSWSGAAHPRRATMHSTYERLRCLDDGLPPIERTNLLLSALWS